MAQDVGRNCDGKPLRKTQEAKGVRYGATVRARLPKDLEQVVRSARRVLGMSLSEFVRTGIEVHLVQMVPRCVELAEDTSVKVSTRLKMMQMLRQMAKSSLILHHPELIAPARTRADRRDRGRFRTDRKKTTGPTKAQRQKAAEEIERLMQDVAPMLTALTETEQESGPPPDESTAGTDPSSLGHRPPSVDQRSSPGLCLGPSSPESPQ